MTRMVVIAIWVNDASLSQRATNRKPIKDTFTAASNTEIISDIRLSSKLLILNIYSCLAHECFVEAAKKESHEARSFLLSSGNLILIAGG